MQVDKAPGAIPRLRCSFALLNCLGLARGVRRFVTRPQAFFARP